MSAPPQERAAVPLLEVSHLTMQFTSQGRPRRALRAVEDARLRVEEQETVALVGESGCGKSTLARCVLRVHEPTSGSVRFRGADVLAADRKQLRQFRREVQLVFQDPHSSMNPRMRVDEIIGEPLSAHRISKDRDELRTRVEALLASVGMPADAARRWPHEFSGGQRQRIAIARALALNPALVICDEAVSSLDVSIQAQIINLLEDLQEQHRISYLFISHDLSVVHHIADRVVVMYLGRVVEDASCDDLFTDPLHPYTRQLLAAAPLGDPEDERSRRGQSIVVGEIPSPMNKPDGCAFRTRCPLADAECASAPPPLVETRPGHWSACFKVR